MRFAGPSKKISRNVFTGLKATTDGKTCLCVLFLGSFHFLELFCIMKSGAEVAFPAYGCTDLIQAYPSMIYSLWKFLNISMPIFQQIFLIIIQSENSGNTCISNGYKNKNGIVFQPKFGVFISSLHIWPNVRNSITTFCISFSSANLSATFPRSIFFVTSVSMKRRESCERSSLLIVKHR